MRGLLKRLLFKSSSRAPFFCLYRHCTFFFFSFAHLWSTVGMQNWNCKNYGGELVAMQWMIEAKGNIRGNIWMPRKGEPISGGRMPFSVFKSTRRGSLYINNISPFPLSLLHLHLPPRHLLPPSVKTFSLTTVLLLNTHSHFIDNVRDRFCNRCLRSSSSCQL